MLSLAKDCAVSPRKHTIPDGHVLDNYAIAGHDMAFQTSLDGSKGAAKRLGGSTDGATCGFPLAAWAK